MTIKLGIVMDPITQINPVKDSSLAMLLSAQARGWQLYYMTLNDLSIAGGIAYAQCARLTVTDDVHQWYHLDASQPCPLGELDVILMRKDPPFDIEYIYTTHLLELAEHQGAWVINRPQALRDVNEKLFTTWFPECCPETLVTRDEQQLRAFLQEHKDVIFKPLEGMGGASIFRCRLGDPNLSVVIEILTQQGARFIMAQRFIPEITRGDKRILMIAGQPIPYALARVPAKGELRGNLAAGAQGVGVELSSRDRWICEQVGPVLVEKGLYFVGLDVIGAFLTEINVTSPTCIRELDHHFDLDIAGQFMDFIAAEIGRRQADNG